MRNEGCAFEVKGGGSARYYTSAAVKGFAEFVRHLHNGAHRPIRLRIPGAVQITEEDWKKLADNNAAGYSCYIIIDIPANEVWVNEDTGSGMAAYCFPFIAVMRAAASGTDDLWERLLAAYPAARKTE